MPPTDPIDAEFVDMPSARHAPGASASAASAAQPSAAAVRALADLLELGGDAARAGATVARVVSPDAAAKAGELADVAHASADVVRSGVAAVESIQAETRRVAGPLAEKFKAWDERARAAGLYGQRAAPRGVHRGPPRPVSVKVGGKP